MTCWEQEVMRGRDILWNVKTAQFCLDFRDELALNGSGSVYV
jgi:hypothetical protein